MNGLWTRLLKSAYRREPISSFILIAGSVSVVIGGVDAQWSLLATGLGVVGTAIALRWLHLRNSQPKALDSPPQRYLPPYSSRPTLPSLDPLDSPPRNPSSLFEE